jgi:hypothetical protein
MARKVDVAGNFHRREKFPEQGIGLERLGVKLERRGMPLFSPHTLQVCDLPVFIVGDANGYLPLLHEAQDEGFIAGRNAIDGPLLPSNGGGRFAHRTARCGTAAHRNPSPGRTVPVRKLPRGALVLTRRHRGGKGRSRRLNSVPLQIGQWGIREARHMPSSASTWQSRDSPRGISSSGNS